MSLTYSVKEAALLLGVSAETVRRAVKAKELPAFQPNRQIRISKAELARYFREKGGGALFKTP